MNKTKDIIETMLAASRLKAETYGSRKNVILGVLGGFYIGLGGLLSLIAGGGLIGAAVFPTGLILIVMVGGRLFTGEILNFAPSALSGSLPWKTIFKEWLTVWMLNFAGALTSVFVLAYCSGTADRVALAVCNLTETKCGLTATQTLLRGVGANLLVCLAVWLGTVSKGYVGKMLGLWLPIFAFVALGYEHCIANMFFLPLGMLYGAEVTAAEVVLNLFYSTLGNMAGGFAVGWAYYNAQ